MLKPTFSERMPVRSRSRPSRAASHSRVLAHRGDGVVEIGGESGADRGRAVRVLRDRAVEQGEQIRAGVEETGDDRRQDGETASRRTRPSSRARIDSISGTARSAAARVRNSRGSGAAAGDAAQQPLQVADRGQGIAKGSARAVAPPTRAPTIRCRRAISSRSRSGWPTSRRRARAPMAVRVRSSTPSRLPRVPPVPRERVSSRLRRVAASSPTQRPGDSTRSPVSSASSAGFVRSR